ncbi:alpha/beta-Hydrolases superfamily protein [Euphorbia peplus]|nr:alpha/beta-Hydrolases superfamily protein [Euphorbia peplus]
MDQSSSSSSPYSLLFEALFLIPLSHYVLAFFISSFLFVYHLLDFHFFQDFVFGGSSVSLIYNPSSPIYNSVVSKCKILHGRYFATPWLASPHIQTCFLNFFGRPPVFAYKRQIYYASDGGTIALDWLTHSDVSGGAPGMNNIISKDDKTPIVILVPGLTSDSASPYIKHFAFYMAKHGWNVVVGNHRGLGGVSVTSDCFYNAGWTEDVRVLVNYLHHEYPNAPLLAVGTSIGANILVKYLGEEGERTHVAGAVAICSPWDLLIGDRFICRTLLQKLYDRALTIGLQGYAKLHEPQYSRLANWEGIKNSRSIRDFDNHATCLVGKFETVDTYYRRCSSSQYVSKVSVPLLCISALDDPLCTSEAIPWDECRANPNIVLATPKHGGHLAFFEGLSATSLWWVRAVDEFLGILHSSPHIHVQKEQVSSVHLPEEISIDQGPYVNITEDGMVAAVGQEEQLNEEKSNSAPETTQTSEKYTKNPNVKATDVSTPVRFLNQISRQNRVSIWFLALVAAVTVIYGESHI